MSVSVCRLCHFCQSVGMYAGCMYAGHPTSTTNHVTEVSLDVEAYVIEPKMSTDNFLSWFCSLVCEEVVPRPCSYALFRGKSLSAFPCIPKLLDASVLFSTKHIMHIYIYIYIYIYIHVEWWLKLHHKGRVHLHQLLGKARWGGDAAERAESMEKNEARIAEARRVVLASFC